MLKLDFSNDALSFLDSLPGKQFKQLVTAIFDLLKTPEPHDSKRLKGYPYRRVDFGEYRIIYRVQNECLQILIVGKRNDGEVYKELSRKGKKR